jgi:hypothetical protein
MQLNSATDFGALETPEDYLRIIRQHSKVLNDVIGKYGNSSINNYLKTLSPNQYSPYQRRDDLVEIIYQYAHELFGDSTAVSAADEFSRDPVVLTANHHGVDYFSHSFQASLMFYLYRMQKSDSFTTVPVFSCGSIPLNNATFPQGMLFYSVNLDQLGTLPLKLPVFPERLKRHLVCQVQPFDKEMIGRADKRLEKIAQEKTLPFRIKEVAETILNQDYSDCSVIGKLSYSDQAVLLNNKIWRRLFHAEIKRTELVYLELEKIVKKLLIGDLRNENSLIYKILFEPVVREAVLHELDGARACWDLNQIKKQALLREVNNDGHCGSKRSGTIFFWGMNEYGKRIPLYLVSSGGNDSLFMGIDDHQQPFQIGYSPEHILVGLGEGRLLPSIFTCYLMISLARGVKLIGSYFQGEYLPNMQEGVVNALRKIPEFHGIAAQVEKTESNFYLSGMLPVMSQVKDYYLVPAGPAEIIAGGGLGHEDINKILSVKVQDAHMASLLETIPDFIYSLDKSSGWKRQIARDSLRQLEGKVVIK